MTSLCGISLPRRWRHDFCKGYGGTLTETSVPKEQYAAVRDSGRNDTGENWRTDTEMIPKHDNLMGIVLLVLILLEILDGSMTVILPKS